MAALIAWIMAHSGLLASVVVAIIDLIFALVPSWQSNGVLHWIYLQLENLLKLPPKP